MQRLVALGVQERLSLGEQRLPTNQDVLQPLVMPSGVRYWQELLVNTQSQTMVPGSSVNARAPTDDAAVTVPTDGAAITPTMQSIVTLSGQEQCRNALFQCRDLLQSTVMLSEQEPLVNLQSRTMESSIEEAGNDDRSSCSDSSGVSTLSESESFESTKVSVRVFDERFAEIEARMAAALEEQTKILAALQLEVGTGNAVSSSVGASDGADEGAL